MPARVRLFSPTHRHSWQSRPWMALAMASSLLLTTLPGIATAVEQREANNGNVNLFDVPEVPASLSAQLKRYQNTRGAGVYDWSADSESLYIGTRFAAVNQIHRVDQSGGARNQLTWFDEPVSAVQRRPQHDELSFTMDSGGSEFSQIFLLDLNSGQHRLLSDGKSRNGALAWSDDGQWLAFQSTRRNGRTNDVWVMNPAQPDQARMLVPADDGYWWGPVAFSPDLKQLLVAQYVSANDSRIWLVDIASGEKRLLTGGGEPATTNIPFAFSGDGKAIYFATDSAGEFTQLATLALDEPMPQARFITQDIPWSVEDFALDHRGQRAAFTTNEDGVSKLYQYFPKLGRYRPVDHLPQGIISGLHFSPDDQKLAFTINNARTPSDAYVLKLGGEHVAANEISRWTFSEVGGLNAEQFATPDLIHYPSFDQADGKARQIPAFIYRPKAQGPYPVVISIHGGPEGQYKPGFSSTYQHWIAELGVAVIAPNVRGSSGYGKSYLQLDNGFKREDSVRDIGALLDWIATQPDLDASRVAVYGGSYGGYMVLASAVHYSDKLKAAVDVVGISNFVTFLENTQDYRRDLRRVEYGDERNPEMRAHLEKISPLSRVGEIKIPMLVAQGHNDPRVPYTEAEQVVAALRQQGNAVWYMDALNEGHGFRKKENRDLFSEITVMFLQEYLLK